MRAPDPTTDRAASLLEKVRAFAGTPRDFWPLFLETATAVTGAQGAMLWARGSPASSALSPVVSHPAGPALDADVMATLTALAGEATLNGFARSPDAVAFPIGGGETGAGVIVLRAPGAGDEGALRRSCALLATLPDAFQSGRDARRLRDELDGVIGALDLALVLARETRFAGAALAVVNDLAARFQCDRVTLGWQGDENVLRLKAVSQADKFDARMQLVRRLEVAMEETLDQDEEIAFPASTDPRSINREHAAYATEAGVSHVASAPLRAGGKPVGVILLERASAPLTEGEWKRLRLASDQVGPRLAELHECAAWFGRRAWRKLKRDSAGLLGPKHTGPKLAGAAGALLILFLAFGRLPYSVEAAATLRSGQVVFVTAPFEGFVQDVSVAVGDAVAEGAPLATFDTRELLLRQAAELANLNRYQKEAERARAQNALAEMRIAQAQADQARAVLDRTRFQLEQSAIRAPFAGVVVEGDLRKRVGSPFRQGEVLVQVARLDDLYVELEIPERDVHDVLGRKDARLLFAAQPETTYALIVERVYPAGQPRAAGPVFLARARSLDTAATWWRPGMSGTVKIDAGWRNVFWILTHRTTAWLRQRLWW